VSNSKESQTKENTKQPQKNTNPFQLSPLSDTQANHKTDNTVKKKTTKKRTPTYFTFSDRHIQNSTAYSRDAPDANGEYDISGLDKLTLLKALWNTSATTCTGACWNDDAGRVFLNPFGSCSWTAGVLLDRYINVDIHGSTTIGAKHFDQLSLVPIAEILFVLKNKIRPPLPYRQFLHGKENQCDCSCYL
jgi:hypothetical protein